MKKLEIGPYAGNKTPDGAHKTTWHTIDSSYKATYRCSWGKQKLPIESLSYDWVHASHVLEHIPWWQTKFALSEVYRILKNDGYFTVWVPDAIKIINLAQNDPSKFLNLEKNWPCGGLNRDKDLWTYLNARVFWGARPGELGKEQHFHRSLFGETYLFNLLEQTGFKNITKITRSKADIGHGWMELGMKGFK